MFRFDDYRLCRNVMECPRNVQYPFKTVHILGFNLLWNVVCQIWVFVCLQFAWHLLTFTCPNKINRHTHYPLWTQKWTQAKSVPTRWINILKRLSFSTTTLHRKQACSFRYQNTRPLNVQRKPSKHRIWIQKCSAKMSPNRMNLCMTITSAPDHTSLAKTIKTHIWTQKRCAKFSPKRMNLYTTIIKQICGKTKCHIGTQKWIQAKNVSSR